MAGEMEARALRLQQRLSQTRVGRRLAEGTKGDAFEARAAAAIAEDATQMVGADDLGFDDAQMRDDEARLAVAGAERPEPVDERGQIRRRRAAGDRAVDRQR